MFSDRRTKDTITALLLGSPAFLLLILFMIWPFLRGIQLSLSDQEFSSKEPTFVNRTDNYEAILSVGIMGLPPKPEQLPEDRPSVGWYETGDGEVAFRWRVNARDVRDTSLDDIHPGLEGFREYEIAGYISIGESEYALVARDPVFWRALWNNIKFALFVVPVQTALALLLAMLINQKLPGMNVFRTFYFSPVVTAMVIIAVVWKFLYNPDFGLINEMLKALGLPPSQWLQSPDTALIAIIILSIWQGVGFQMIIFLAGLQDIPEDLYEAAGIDGAGIIAKFRYVTLPMLRNTMIFVVLTTTILAFRLFDQVNVMTPDGGPGDESTATMVWYAIRAGWGSSEIGYASAISVVFVAIVLLISIVQRGIVRSDSALER